MLLKIYKLSLLILAFLLRPFIKVKKGRVVCMAYYKKQYSCNPKYISEYITKYHSDQFEVFWLLDRGVKADQLSGDINIIRYPSLRTVFIINSAEFVFNNCRLSNYSLFWVKLPSQKYIQTWHASLGIKKAEAACEEPLPANYVRIAKKDSRLADLFISGSRFMTDGYRKYYWYDGEILEKGFPRNDIFFNKESILTFEQEVRNYYKIPQTDKIILYAPTFRDDYSLKYYNIDWTKIVPCLKKMFSSDVTVLIRLHPNFVYNGIDTRPLINHNKVIDATRFYDMQPLAVAADMLITDFSSCMFDVAYMGKICFTYAIDVDTYDRGTFYKITELPFPFAENNNQLEKNILMFDINEYRYNLRDFMTNELGSIDDGHACEAIVEWMTNHQIKR